MIKRREYVYVAPWSEDDLRILRERWPDEGPYPLVDVLGRTQKAIDIKARKIGLVPRYQTHQGEHTQQPPTPYEIEYRCWCVVNGLPIIEVSRRFQKAS